MTDLLDRTGRLRRLAIALVLRAIAGALVWTLTDQLAQPDANHSRDLYACTWPGSASGDAP